MADGLKHFTADDAHKFSKLADLYAIEPFKFEENGEWGLMDVFGQTVLPCEWNYRNNLNTLFFSVKKHSKSSALPLLAAILAAAALGFCSQWIPQSVTEAASAYLLVPFREAFLGLLNALAGILIFFTVLAGLCGDKDTEPLGAKSRRMLIRVPVMMAVFAVFSYLLLLPFSGLSFSGASAAQSQTKEIADLLWGIVPIPGQ